MTEGYDLDSGPDPAAIATEAPESTHPTNPVYAVGIGPGNPSYLTPRGERAIREADVVVGFETVVGYIRDRTDAELFTCSYADEADTLCAFAERVADGAAATAVLMGDPNFSGYQFVGKIQTRIDRPLCIIPGISSLQIAASRARTPMEATTFCTLHKSGDITPDLERLCAHAGERHLLVLPRPFDWMPGDIAGALIDSGAPESLTAIVCERLTHDDESITRTTLPELAAHAGDTGPDSTPFSDLSVLAVRANG